MAEIPIVFLVYDLLEIDGQDARAQPLSWRRQALEKLLSQVDTPRLKLSPVIEAESWQALEALWQKAKRALG